MDGKASYQGAHEEFISKFFLDIGPVLKKKRAIEEGTTVASKKETYLLDIGHTTAEIDGCFELIKLMPRLITHHSSYQEKIGFRRVQQHRRSIEWYFDEMYILNVRFAKLINSLKGYARKSSCAKESDEMKLLNTLSEYFKPHWFKSCEADLNPQ